MIEFRIGNQIEELKFNYHAKWKADKLFSSEDENGNSTGNGSAVVWVGLISEKSDTALISALRAMTNHTEEEIVDAIEKNAEQVGGIENLVEQFAKELEQSDFFKFAAKQFLKQEERSLEILGKRENKTQEDEANIAGLKDGIQMMKETL